MRTTVIIPLIVMLHAAGPRTLPAQTGPAPAPPPASSAESVTFCPIRVCVLDGGALRDVTVTYRIATFDTLYEGRLFREAFPVSPDYAGAAEWFTRGDPIVIGDRAYAKYGLPRVLGASEVVRVDEYAGVGVFAATGETAPGDVIYVPVRPGCEFQPYVARTKT